MMQFPMPLITDEWDRLIYQHGDQRITAFGTPRKETMLTLAKDTPPGAIVEFGVHQGGSAWRLAQLALEQGRTCHLFDTFCGIPESGEHDVYPVGALADVDLAEVQRTIPTAIFHVGVFPDTMPENFEPIAFCHIDCDQYQSCLAGVQKFMPYMVKNGVMLFDDFNVTPGVHKAVNDLFEGRYKLTREGKAYISC